MRRKSIYLLLLCIGYTSSVFSQRRLKNQPKYDTQGLHFGFSIGMNYSNFNINTYDLVLIPGFYGVRTEVNPGYAINIVSDLRLNDNFSLRFLPGYATTTRFLYFDVDDPFSGERTELLREVESSYMEAPFEVKFRGDRIDNYRWYLLGGFKYTFDLASKEDVEDDEFFKIAKADYGYELGIGIDFYFEYFKFSPQLRATFGLKDLLVEDGTVMVTGIRSIRTRAIMINLTFE